MTIAWTGFPSAVAATSADVLVGLAGGTTNARFLGSSFLLAADNLSNLGSVPAAITNLGVSATKGAGASSSKGGNGSSAAAGAFSWAFGNAAVATNDGSVVWGDSNAAPNVDSAANQFNLTFANGYRLWGGSVNVMTAGKGLAVKEGSNAKQGVVTLAAGVGIVANTSVTANSRILFSPQDANTTGFLKITARTNGSGFTITSSVNTDTGVVAYQIFEPAA